VKITYTLTYNTRAMNNGMSYRETTAKIAAPIHWRSWRP